MSIKTTHTHMDIGDLSQNMVEVSMKTHNYHYSCVHLTFTADSSKGYIHINECSNDIHFVFFHMNLTITYFVTISIHIIIYLCLWSN